MQKRQISQKVSSYHLLILKQRKVLKSFASLIWLMMVSTSSLDDVFFWNEMYTSLWKVIIFVFTLSHGQAQIKRGFNINADLLVENLTSLSIVAQRSIYDHLSVTKNSPHGIEIKDKLRVSCLNASSKYKRIWRRERMLEKVKMKKKKLMLFWATWKR